MRLFAPVSHASYPHAPLLSWVQVRQVVVSPDGLTIATCSMDKVRESTNPHLYYVGRAGHPSPWSVCRPSKSGISRPAIACTHSGLHNLICLRVYLIPVPPLCVLRDHDHVIESIAFSNANADAILTKLVHALSATHVCSMCVFMLCLLRGYVDPVGMAGAEARIRVYMH